jgi:DNA-binding MarR family transcriptional regulator
LSREQLTQELGAVVRMHQNAVDAVDEAATQLLGINRTDGRCLDLIDQAGRLTAGQLAERSGLTSGAVTAVLDRLEQAGLIVRVRDDVDRRRVFVELTPEAHRRVGEIYGPIAHEGAALMARYSDEQLAAFAEMTRAATELLVEHATRLRAQGR